ncbi:ATP-binding protein [Streptomyces sp. NBC_01716]|uniref:ATP-binding protein n=1 Tax=Streptomyces sp. NBC_01716 TaxID=2975917 RepID=UPI002E30CDE9|nr:ATP-binding protein [Streptomyces sp. NBC_01716]
MLLTPLAHCVPDIPSRRSPAFPDDIIPTVDEWAIGRGPMRAGRAAMSFDADPRHVESARQVTAAVLGEAGVKDCEIVETVQLMVSEIVTNAIVHGNANSVSLRLTCDAADEVLIEVDDHSSGSPELRDAGPDDESGRGMRLVTYFAREWGRKGTCTWCTVPVGPASV